MSDHSLERTPDRPVATIATGRVSPSRDVLYQQVDGVAVLLNLQSERYFSLDPVGTRIWLLLSQRIDLGAICERLLAAYDVDEVTIRRDVTQFIDRLKTAGLVVVEP